MKSKILCFCFLICSLGVMSQQTEAPINTATINEEYVITLNESENSEIPDDQVLDNYVLDVSEVNFISSEKLNQFCMLFSFDMYTFNGDFESNQIIIEFDQEVIESKNLTRQDVNEFFSEIAPRMSFIVNQS